MKTAVILETRGNQKKLVSICLSVLLTPRGICYVNNPLFRYIWHHTGLRTGQILLWCAVLGAICFPV